MKIESEGVVRRESKLGQRVGTTENAHRRPFMQHKPIRHNAADRHHVIAAKIALEPEPAEIEVDAREKLGRLQFELQFLVQFARQGSNRVLARLGAAAE